MNNLVERSNQAYKEGQRVVAPLLGFPGVALKPGSSIKLAQQNSREHYRIIKLINKLFDPDVLFPLMDLSVEANALGRYTDFPVHESATVIKSHFNYDDIDNMANIDISYDSRLRANVETMQLMSIGLPPEKLKAAYVAGPYTLAGLLTGADEAAMATILEPDNFHRLCRFTTEKIKIYANQLVAAGAESIIVLEPSAVMLSPDLFTEFSANYIKNIVDSFKYLGVSVVYHTCGNTTNHIQPMIQSGVHGISLDSEAAGVSLPTVAPSIPENVAIIGNISPTDTLVNGTPDQVRDEVNALLTAMDPYPNFILSTGCDIPPEAPRENLLAFMQAGRNYRIITRTE